MNDFTLMESDPLEALPQLGSFMPNTLRSLDFFATAGAAPSDGTW